MKQAAAAARISPREAVVFAIASFVVLASFLTQQGGGREPLASAETRFADTSSRGLQIVPASCPSDPHYTGECSTYAQSSYDTPGGGCEVTYSCSGSNLINNCTGNVAQVCSYACSSGFCIYPPEPELEITATPTLLRRGETSVISWTSENMDSCVVTENNPSISNTWTGTSGTQTSGAIEEQTIYTLTCEVDDEELTDSVTVNIIPVFEEQ